METFLRLFGSLLTFVYHCFDRIVIFGYPLKVCGNVRERLESASTARDVRAPKDAETKGHAFMRPVTQKAIAFCLRQVVFEGAGNRISWENATGRLQTDGLGDWKTTVDRCVQRR